MTNKYGNIRDRTKFELGYRELIAKRETFYGPELDRIYKVNQRLNLETGIRVLSILTERQSMKFAEELVDLSEDFAELAAEADDLASPSST